MDSLEEPLEGNKNTKLNQKTCPIAFNIYSKHTTNITTLLGYKLCVHYSYNSKYFSNIFKRSKQRSITAITALMALWLENARCNVQRDAYFKSPTFKRNKNILFKFTKANVLTKLLTIFNRGFVKTDAKRRTKQTYYYVTLNNKHNNNPRTKHTNARSYIQILYSVTIKPHHHGRNNKN